MFVKPFNCSLMFFPNITDNPNDYFCIVARRIGDDFTKMIVVSIFKLIFNNNFSARAFFFRQNIDFEVSNICFNLCELYINVYFLAKQIKILG